MRSGLAVIDSNDAGSLGSSAPNSASNALGSIS
jgi:hypothetical protein